jgi:hypothetical protein
MRLGASFAVFTLRVHIQLFLLDQALRFNQVNNPNTPQSTPQSNLSSAPRRILTHFNFEI